MNATETNGNKAKVAASTSPVEREVMRDWDGEEGSWFCEDGILECDTCGADLSLGYPDGDGCPFCLSCAGAFSPGTEECDFCKWYNYCSSAEAMARYYRSITDGVERNPDLDRGKACFSSIRPRGGVRRRRISARTRVSPPAGGHRESRSTPSVSADRRSALTICITCRRLVGH